MLIKEELKISFNSGIIRPGHIIRTKHKSWQEPRNGLVSRVSPDKLIVISTMAQSYACSYIAIAADEVAAGDWEITWSPDLSCVHQEGGTE